MSLLFRLSLIATLAVLGPMALWSLPLIAEAAGGLAAPDMRYGGYTGDEMRAFLAALSDAGRAHFLGTQRILDLIYPALFALTVALAVFRYGARLALVWRGLLALVALVPAGADYAENALVAQMLQMPPEAVTDAQVAQASLLTQVKFASTGLALGMVLILAIGFAIGRRRRIRRRAARQARS